MSMIVARMQKMKAENLTGIGNHNQRKTENHSNKEIEIDRSYLNYDLVDQTENYKTDIQNFINEKKDTERAIRKDAVLVNEWIISSDSDFFENLSEERTMEFFDSSKNYFAENFGEDNIRYAIVHLDETTPHMHMGVVPFDKDNKLSAKRVFNRAALQDIQNELPKKLKRKGFEIERGRKGSEQKNLTVPEYKELQSELKEVRDELSLKKQEMLAYNQELEKDEVTGIKVIYEEELVKVPTGKSTFLGKKVMKTVAQETGKIIVDQENLEKITDVLKHSKEIEKRLNHFLDTDLFKENKKLKEENEFLKERKIELEQEHIENNQYLEKEWKEEHQEKIKMIEGKFEDKELLFQRDVKHLENGLRHKELEVKEISDELNTLSYENKTLEKFNGHLKNENNELETQIGLVYECIREHFKELTDNPIEFKEELNVFVDNITHHTQKFSDTVKNYFGELHEYTEKTERKLIQAEKEKLKVKDKPEKEKPSFTMDSLEKKNKEKKMKEMQMKKMRNHGMHR